MKNLLKNIMNKTLTKKAHETFRVISTKNENIHNSSAKKFIVDESVIEDLIDFSGLSKDYITKHLNREENYSYTFEFKVRSPLDDSELEWFYITSEKYLFANIAHEPWKLIDKIKRGKILDFGGGTGVDTFYLANLGYEVDYFDISIIQREFVKFKKNKYSFENVNVIDPFFEGKFNPISCITDKYDGILVRSLLEHVPYYPKLSKHLISSLKNEGILYEASPFGFSTKDPMHLEETESLEDIFTNNGLILIFQDGVHRCWQKDL